MFTMDFIRALTPKGNTVKQEVVACTSSPNSDRASLEPGSVRVHGQHSETLSTKQNKNKRCAESILFLCAES